VYTPHEPDPATCTTRNRHQSAYLPWGFSLGMLGHIATNMWEYFQYKPDTVYLTNKIYPIIRDMALFYCSFLEKCRRDGSNKFIIGPSYFAENGNFGQDNTSYDIAYITYCLNAAKEAAAILNTDATLITRINNALNAMPYYSTVADPNQGNQTIIEEWRGAGVPNQDRHASDIQSVYPAGVINGFSPQSEKDLLIRTIAKVSTIDETNAYISLNVARARLGLSTDAYNNTLTSPRPGYQYYMEQPNGLFWMNEGHEYYISEQTAYARLVSELLLQSVGNVMRVYPSWPANRNAKFTRLRAQGGFLVSAEMNSGVIGDITVKSTAGGMARLVSPWPTIQVRFQDNSTQQLTPGAQSIVQVATTGGQTYVFQRPSTGTFRVEISQGSHRSISLIVKYARTISKKTFHIPADMEKGTLRPFIALFDLNGRLVAGRHVGNEEILNSVFVFDLDRPTVSPGIYYLNIRYGKRNFSTLLNLM
jgi:hypothetical protein